MSPPNDFLLWRRKQWEIDTLAFSFGLKFSEARRIFSEYRNVSLYLSYVIYLIFRMLLLIQEDFYFQLSTIICKRSWMIWSFVLFWISYWLFSKVTFWSLELILLKFWELLWICYFKFVLFLLRISIVLYIIGFIDDLFVQLSILLVLFTVTILFYWLVYYTENNLSKWRTLSGWNGLN